jgi:hypothetical protein
MKNLKNNLTVIAVAIALGIMTAVLSYPPTEFFYKYTGICSLFWICIFMPAFKID